MPLTNLAAGEILDADALPLRFTAYTPCFRAEAGARTARTCSGLIRQHQFNKVELVQHHERPEDSEATKISKRMTANAEKVLQLPRSSPTGW